MKSWIFINYELVADTQMSSLKGTSEMSDEEIVGWGLVLICVQSECLAIQTDLRPWSLQIPGAPVECGPSL